MIIIRLITWSLLCIVMTGCATFNYFIMGEPTPTAQPDDAQIAFGASDQAPPDLTWVEGDTAFDLGTYCWTLGDLGVCADMMPAAYEQDEHIRVNEANMTLTFERFPAESISAYVHPGSNLMTRIADIPLDATLAQDGTINVILPDTLEGEHVLVINANWMSNPLGDAIYTLPITINR
ncbi:MAG: hypothetical protein ACFE0Q_20355 [Anaerolineae bacterium]